MGNPTDQYLLILFFTPPQQFAVRYNAYRYFHLPVRQEAVCPLCRLPRIGGAPLRVTRRDRLLLLSVIVPSNFLGNKTNIRLATLQQFR
jgi:hypothetical protein